MGAVTVSCSLKVRDRLYRGGAIFSDSANDPEHLAGPWEDLGLNEYGEFCATTYAVWLHDHFGAAERDDDTISGPFATPAGDRIPNLLKYAVGLDPLQSYPSALPPPEIRTIEGDGEQKFLTLTFSHPSGLTGIDYDVRLSPDTRDWSESAILIEEDDGEITTRTYRDTEPIEEAGARFMRLEVRQK